MAKRPAKVTTAPLDPETDAILTNLAKQTGQSKAQLSKALIRLGAIAFSEHCQQRGRNIGGGHGS